MSIFGFPVGDSGGGTPLENPQVLTGSGVADPTNPFTVTFPVANDTVTLADGVPGFVKEFYSADGAEGTSTTIHPAHSFNGDTVITVKNTDVRMIWINIVPYGSGWVMLTDIVDTGATASLSGDVTGFLSNTTVSKLAGHNLANSPPTDGQVLTWNNAGNQWQPSAPATNAVTIQSRAVSSAVPTDGQVLTWNNSGTQWQPVSPAVALKSKVPLTLWAAGAATAGSTLYLGPNGTWSTTPVVIYQNIYSGSQIKNMLVQAGTAPGSGESAVFTLMQSIDRGATWTNTVLTCTVSDVSPNANDYIHTSTAAGAPYWYAVSCITSAASALASVAVSLETFSGE